MVESIEQDTKEIFALQFEAQKTVQSINEQQEQRDSIYKKWDAMLGAINKVNGEIVQQGEKMGVLGESQKVLRERIDQKEAQKEQSEKALKLIEVDIQRFEKLIFEQKTKIKGQEETRGVCKAEILVRQE